MSYPDRHLPSRRLHTQCSSRRNLKKSDAIEADMVHGEEIRYEPHMFQLGSKLLNEDLPKWLGTGAIMSPPYRMIDGVGEIQAALNVLQAGESNQKVLVPF
jgi:hypothetical protein